MTLPAFLQQAAPAVAVDIAPERVAVVRVERRGGTLAVAAYGVEALPPGVVTASLVAPNVTDLGVVSAAIARAMSTASVRPGRVALVVPDSVARVSLVRFESLPAKAADLDELIRWQIRKTTPFPLEDAALTYTPGLATAGGHEFVVTAARRDVIGEYERACEMAGAHAGIVDLATFNVVNVVLAAPPPVTGDWLLVHASSSYVSLAVVRDGHLIFYRTRGEASEGSVADLVHQTAMYYQDRLGGRQFGRVLLAGASTDPGADVLRRELSERLGLDVTPVDPFPGAAPAARVGASPSLADALAPGIGVLLRDQAAS